MRLFHPDPHRRGQQRFLRRIRSRELPGNFSLAHDIDAMAETKNFGQLRGDNQNAATLRREVDYELIDFGFGPHIDTARGLIEDQESALGEEPASQYRFLLVPSRKACSRVVRVTEP